MCWLAHRVTILGFVDEYRIDDRPVLFTEKMNLKKNDCRVWGSLGVLTWKTWSKLLRNRSLQSPGTTESMYRVPVTLSFQKWNYGLLNLRPGICKNIDLRFCTFWTTECLWDQIMICGLQILKLQLPRSTGVLEKCRSFLKK